MKKIISAVLLVLVFILPVAGCSSTVAAVGDTVKVDFTIWLDDGTLYYSTQDMGPSEYTLGTESMIPGAEEAIIGMKVGDSREVTIPAAKAYGEVNPGLIQEVSRDLMPAGFDVEVGKELNTTLNGQTINVVITAVTDTTVTIDGNHFLAGREVVFDVNLLEIRHPFPATYLGQPILVWILGSGLILLAISFLLFFLLTQRRFRQIQASRIAVPRNRIKNTHQTSRVGNSER